MGLEVIDANGSAKSLPQWVDRVYRFAGSVTAAQAAGTACDILLITAAAAATVPVTRLLWVKLTYGGGGTAGPAGGVIFTLNRVTAAPTGQTNVAVTGRPHVTVAAGGTAPSTTCAITPSTTQTAGTSPLILGQEAADNSLLSTGGDKLQVSRVAFACGTEHRQQPIVIDPSGFITVRMPVAAPSGSVISFDIGVSEASE